MTRLRVQVVDDNSDVVIMLCALIERMGHECRTAQSGHEALQLAAAYDPDVVLLDLGLPDITGYDVARELRASGSKARIVAVTGWGRPDDIARSRAAGMDAHFTKPVAVTTLAKVLGGAEGAEPHVETSRTDAGSKLSDS